MIFKVFAIFDSKIGAYMQPFMMQSNGQAVRAFIDAASDPNTQFSKHPGDFTLFAIADYDDETGSYENYPAKINLGTALENQPKTNIMSHKQQEVNQ